MITSILNSQFFILSNSVLFCFSVLEDTKVGTVHKSVPCYHIMWKMIFRLESSMEFFPPWFGSHFTVSHNHTFMLMLHPRTWCWKLNFVGNDKRKKLFQGKKNALLLSFYFGSACGIPRKVLGTSFGVLACVPLTVFDLNSDIPDCSYFQSTSKLLWWWRNLCNTLSWQPSRRYVEALYYKFVKSWRNKHKLK